MHGPSCRFGNRNTMKIGLSQEPDVLAVQGPVAHTAVRKSLIPWTKDRDPPQCSIACGRPVIRSPCCCRGPSKWMRRLSVARKRTNRYGNGKRSRRAGTANSVPSTDRLTLTTEIQKSVKTGSTIYTDDHGAYRNLNQLGYQHRPLAHSAGEYVKHGAHTNGIESVWAVLKRGYYGTYHQWSQKHMRRYVDEFTFRLNAGDVQFDTLDRIASLSKAMTGKRLRYRELTANPI